MQKSNALFNDESGAHYHLLALAYISLSYVGGFAGLFHDAWWVNALACIALAHAMIIAAYMVHEAGHNTIFRKQRHNVRLGRALAWICGAAYGTFEDIRYKHFRHHIENDDIVWFDYEKFFLTHPRITKLTQALEWLYIPAHELIMHFVMVFSSFIIPHRRNQRSHNVRVIVIRGGLFLLLAIFATKAALFYAIAYLLMIIVLRFMDSLQHDYPYSLTLFDTSVSPHKGDPDWEQAHTFSNPLSLRYPWLNLLTLNFGYHNAHHADPNVPWYRLPAHHRALFGDDPKRVIPFAAQLRIYHRGRVRRIVKWDRNEDPAPVGPDFLEAARRGTLYGGNAASFLTSF